MSAPNGQPWIPMTFCGGDGGGPGSGPITSIVSFAQFDQAFPSRNPFYTYAGFTAAANALPAFCGTGDTAMKRRECAAAFANFYHETGGLWYITEINQGLYCDTSITGPCACAAGQKYYGRGPIQLSWNFNYCGASQWLYGDYRLVSNPSIVEQNSDNAWRAAIWYWMTQTGPNVAGHPLVTAHDAIIGNYGFGETIRAINGALECNGGNGGQVQSRIDQFNRMLSIFGSSAVGPNGC